MSALTIEQLAALSLEEQISRARLEISADSISMSISELTNLYREKTLDIRPEFQRLFRWSVEQKSRLVESILLGIPLPSLFVSQSESGTWELVDGLQRTSTILELQGLLPGRSHLQLSGTRYLPGLEDVTWDGRDGTKSLSNAQRLDIRLARLDLKVIKRSSDTKVKFDLFQRLNSFGSTLTAQEIRSALIAGVSSDCLAWLTRLAGLDSFKATVSLSERLIDEQYDLELVLRFLMLHNRDIDGKRGGLGDFSAKLDDWAVTLAEQFTDHCENLELVFRSTFDSLIDRGSEDVFRKWDQARNQFRGSFSNTAFEFIAMGAGYHVSRNNDYRGDVMEAARLLWSLLPSGFATGLATGDRFAKTVRLGRRLMSSTPETLGPLDFS